MNNKDLLKKFRTKELIYFFAADERYSDILKVGKTYDMIMRLYNYSVGRIKEPELKYLAIVKNSKLIEGCISELFEDNKVYQKKELYRICINKLKKLLKNAIRIT